MAAAWPGLTSPSGAQAGGAYFGPGLDPARRGNHLSMATLIIESVHEEAHEDG